MNTKILLGIDTSGPRLQLALRVGEQTHTHIREIARGHAEILFDQLADFVSLYEVTFADLDKIIVTTGPGSFTGLRIGIAAARGLGLALKCPVIGIENLHAMSLDRPLDEPQSNFSIVVDARRNQFYAQKFINAGKPLSDPELIDQQNYNQKYASSGVKIITDAQVNMVKLMEFAAHIDPDDYPPVPCYVRAADAKPQTKMLIARQGAT